MAIVQDEDKQGTNGDTGQSSFFGGGGSSGVGATTKVASPSSSGNYTNLNAYLNANQGAGQAMAGDIANNINATGTGFDTGLNLWNAGERSAIASGESDPTSAGYTGPSQTDVINAGPNQGQLQNLNTMLSQAQSGNLSDLGTLIKGTQSGQNPGYTSGENTLDAYLTGAQGQDTLKNVGWGGENERYQNIQDALSGLAGAGQSTWQTGNDKYKADQAAAAAAAAAANTSKPVIQPLERGFTPATTQALKNGQNIPIKGGSNSNATPSQAANSGFTVPVRQTMTQKVTGPTTPSTRSQILDTGASNQTQTTNFGGIPQAFVAGAEGITSGLTNAVGGLNKGGRIPEKKNKRR